MTRTTRLDLSLEPEDTAQPFIIFNELVAWLESGYTEYVKDSLSASMTIPAGYQYIVYGSFDVAADLTLEGALVIL